MKLLRFAAAGLCALWLGTANVQAASNTLSFDTGSSVAGMGTVLDQYVDSETEGKGTAQAVSTQEKIRYGTFRSMFTNLGVAEVKGTLNIRKAPKSDAEIVGTLSSHGGCNILSSQNGWYKVRSGRVTGYVYGKYLSTGRTAFTSAYYNMELMVRVNTATLRVRSAPNTESEILGRIYEGETYPILSQAGGGWVRIQYGKSQGYVCVPGNASAAYTLTEAVPVFSVRGRVVNYALEFVGNPYQWGGTDPNTGADCSGFVQYVMEHGAGVEIDRTSRQQAREGQAVMASQMLPGDLLFYASGQMIDHVAMYIGNGRIVHAANSRSGIKISKWNYRSPVTIRRVIP